MILETSQSMRFPATNDPTATSKSDFLKEAFPHLPPAKKKSLMVLFHSPRPTKLPKRDAVTELYIRLGTEMWTDKVKQILARLIILKMFSVVVKVARTSEMSVCYVKGIKFLLKNPAYSRININNDPDS
jgi:hypothetical protein